MESVYAIRSQSMGCLFKSDSGLNLTVVSSKVTVFPDFQVFLTVNKLSKNFKPYKLCFIPSRVASLEVVKSTAFFGPAQIINRTKSLKINILIGLNLINMVIKT